MDYESLRQAYLAHMRSTSIGHSAKLIKTIGKADSLGTVAENLWPALAAAFKAATPDTAKAAVDEDAPETKTRADVPRRTMTLDDLQKSAWNRFNNPPQVNRSPLDPPRLPPRRR